MRIRLSVLIGALLLVSASVTNAQTNSPNPPSPYQPPVSFMSGRTGTLDVGFRASDINDDTGRYQRYRDLRDGAFLEHVNYQREKATWLFNAEATNLGYRDQRFFAGFNRLGLVKASFEWDQVPTFYSTYTKSLHSYAGNGVFLIDDAIQQGIQGGTMRLIDPSVLGQARSFDTRSRSDNALFTLVVTPARDVDVTLDVKSKARTGTYVGNVNFGFANAIELNRPLDDRTTDITASAEWANRKGRVSVGYVGSWYDNQITAIRFDNPLRYTDIVGTPSVGQMADWPSTSAHTVNTAGSIALPFRSKASAFVSLGTWRQNDALLPATVNTALVAPVLERPTAEAEARVVATNVNFNARPAKYVWLNAKYRFYDYANRTPVFDISSMVVGDNTLGAAHETEPAGFQRHNFDVDASFTPWTTAGFKVGYGREVADRTFRIFERTSEHVFRTSADLTGYQHVTVRGVYEHSQRTGSRFEPELLAEVGEHLEMRHYDIADRDRDRGTVMVTVTPIDALGFNASVAAGRDDYKNSGFGLRDNEHRIYSAGVDVVPNAKTNVNLTYGLEKYDSSQWSRTANPLSATDVTFLDPRRDWGLDTGDRVRTLSSALGLTQLVPKTELTFTYDYSWSKATYVYVVPSVTVIPTPSPLPPVDNRLSTFRTDARYFLTRNVAIGVMYRYEQYRVNDFAMSPDTVNSIVPLTTAGAAASGIYLNYLYRPYTANTGWVRLTYLW